MPNMAISSLLSGGAGGLSLSDSTRVSFDPFADNSKRLTQQISVKTGLDLKSALPWILLAAIALVAYKLFK